VQDGDGRDGQAGHPLREARRRERETETEAEPELVGPGLDRLADERGEIGHTLDWMDDRAVRDRLFKRMELELEGGRDPEVGARAAEPPEQVGMLLLAGADDPAVRGHEVDRAQAVDREP
jgi:hypothetical protein